MSYNNQYPPQQGYGYPPPAPQYGQQQPPQHGQYPPQQAPSPYQSSGYGSPPPAPQYGDQGNYGPPQQGGFQHGQVAPYQDNKQVGGQYGYPQQQPQGQYPGAPPAQQYPQQGPYGQSPHPPQHGQPGQGFGPTDPNAQAEGDRGLLGAIGGGAAGYVGGSKFGGHGLLGALAGAFAGHKLEEKAKNSKHKHGHGHSKW